MEQWNLHLDSAANFPPPHNMHPVVTGPGTMRYFNFHPTPPYNIVNPELRAADLDFTVAAFSAHCNPCFAPLSEWNISYSDDFQSFKTKSSDEAPMNYQFQGNYVAPTVQLPANPWLDVHSSGICILAWSQAPSAHYVHGVSGYQTTDIYRSATGFPHPPIVHFHSNSSHPIRNTQGVRGSRVTASPHRRMPQINSSNTGISTFLDAAATSPMFMPPIPPTNFWSYGPHQREIILDPNARLHVSPHLRVLPEDEVAILELPVYQEAGDPIPIDQHRDMRLDIDHMSYEELLALGEHIGSVRTGLTEAFIRNNLKMSTFMLSPACYNLEQHACLDQPKINFCVICQDDYEYEECIGKLDCGHEYHGECITRWLLVKNACPVCKATALISSKTMDL